MSRPLDRIAPSRLVEQYAQGLPEDQRGMAMANPEGFLKARTEAMFRENPQPAILQSYAQAKKEGYAGNFIDYQRDIMRAGQTPEAAPSNVREWQYFQGLSPEQQRAYLTMKRANPYLDLGNEKVQPDPMSPGTPLGSFPMGIAPKQEYDEKGNRIVTMSPQSGASLSPGAATTSTPGAAAPAGPQASGPKVQELPLTADQRSQFKKAVEDADYTLQLVQGLLDHPGMKSVVGVPDNPVTGIPAKLGAAIPGTDAAAFLARLEQIQGRQFLEAFERLRGGGQITVIEGIKATNAISRLMQTGQPESEYRKAAAEFAGIVSKAKERIQSRLGGGEAQAGWSIQRVE